MILILRASMIGMSDRRFSVTRVRHEVICADALLWLPVNLCSGYGIATSPPDAEEIGADLRDWAAWFLKAVDACLGNGGPVVFYVTDRLHGGRRISKAALIFRMARARGVPLVWHKIALRRGIGKVDIRRAGYSHVLAFGNCKAGRATPDVLNAGPMLYRNATGETAAALMAAFIADHCDVLVDPFCGQGAILRAGLEAGLSVVGVDIDDGQCAKARALLVR